MKKYFLCILLIFVGKIGFSQQSSPTSHQLYKLFKSSINQPYKKRISVGNNAWIICNHDSAFFKDDTLNLYDELNYFYQKSNCCDFIEWTFYKKKAFVQSNLQICKEPSSSSVANDYYEIKLFSDKQTLYLIVTKWHYIAWFKVIKIDNIKLANNQSTAVITLKRMLFNKPLFVQAAH